MNKKVRRGDGKIFHTAVREHVNDIDSWAPKYLGVSKSTVYNWFDQEILEPFQKSKIKEALPMIVFDNLGTSIRDIVKLPYISYYKRERLHLDLYQNIDLSETYTIFNSGLTINRVYITIEIGHDFMDPQLKFGDIALGYEQKKEEWGNVSGVVAICFGNEFMVRRIKENKLQETNRINLHADNKEFGGEISVKYSDVKMIWKLTEKVKSTII